MDFNYETQKIVGQFTKRDLLVWIKNLHTELTDNGHLPGSVSDETHQQLVILAITGE